MNKNVFLIIAVLSLWLVSVGNKQETNTFTEAQEAELINTFIEKVEYAYNYRLWFVGDVLRYTEQGYRKENLEVVLYWNNGVYYFVPLDDCDTKLYCENDIYHLVPFNGENIKQGTKLLRSNQFYSGRYVFHALWQKSGVERDVGEWSFESSTSVELDEVKKFINLGIVEINTSGMIAPELPILMENEYIDAIVNEIKKHGQKGHLLEGNYKIYFGLYLYYDDVDRIVVTGVMRQNETFRFFDGSAIRNSDGSYEAEVHSTNGASEWFPTVEEATYAHEEAMSLVEAERLVIDLEIINEKEEGVEKTDDSAHKEQEKNTMQAETQSIEMTLEEAKERISELYNYYQWFYVNMPYDIEVLLEEGETYHVYTDGNGGVYWRKNRDEQNSGNLYAGIFKAELQENIVDLPLYSYQMEACMKSDLQKIGTMVWHKPELQKPKLLLLEEDEYIKEVEKYIRNDLSQKGKSGEYQIYFGRYEILSSDVRSISVAVTGEETYYLQCWVTKYQDDLYGCFPVGGSYAGEQSSGVEKAKRIVQLERLKVQL